MLVAILINFNGILNLEQYSWIIVLSKSMESILNTLKHPELEIKSLGFILLASVPEYYGKYIDIQDISVLCWIKSD